MSRDASWTQGWLRRLRAEHRTMLLAAGLASAVTTGGSVLLLGLSGSFIAGAAVAGAGGAAAVTAFNYLLPSAGIRALAILRTAGRYGERLASHTAALEAMAALRAGLFQRLVSAPPQNAMALSNGEASARLIQDVDALEIHFVALSANPAAVVAITAGTGLVAFLNGPAVLVLLAGVAGQTLAGRWLSQRYSRAQGAAGQAALGQLKGRLSALTAAAPELACYDYQDEAVDLVMQADAVMAVSRRDSSRGDAILAGLQAVMSGLVAVGVLVCATHAPVATAALAVFAALGAMDGAAGLLRAFDRQGAFDAAVQRLDEVAPTPTGPDQLSGLPAGGPAFHLPSGDINLASGARVALVGPSGCGKTQIVERLLALRPDPDHTVRFGGEPVERLSPLHLRAQFAYAPQDAMALSGTVRDNLLLGRADATEADLWQVLHLAVLDQRVTALPKGLDTWVGEAGEALSGGERKRLSVARALLRTAAWLVLDEPSEGLDATTEALLVERLRAHLDATGQGLILISHRLPPLALCSERISVSPG